MPRFIWVSAPHPYSITPYTEVQSRIATTLEDLFDWFGVPCRFALFFSCEDTGEASTQRARLRSLLLSDPLAISEEFTPVGVYSVVANNFYVTDSSGIPLTLDYRVATEYVNSLAGRNASLDCRPTTSYELIPRYLPPVPEIVGGTYSFATNKSDRDASFRTCGNCGLVGHNVRTCTAASKAYAKIGVELEGRWGDLDRTLREAQEYGADGCSDGSVNPRDGSGCSPHEIQTKPGSLGECLHQVVRFYPDETDASCGMHVHVSFANVTDFTCLSTAAFFAYFKARWTNWGVANNLHPEGEFFRRLRGDNQYCIPNRDEPRWLTNMDRYHQLNFSAYNEHKTVECRLLPMFVNQTLAVLAIQELIDIYQTFLTNPEEHGLTLPVLDVAVEEDFLPAQIVVREVEIPAAMVIEMSPLELEISEPPSPAPGMVRVVVPGGQINYQMLQRIARRAA